MVLKKATVQVLLLLIGMAMLVFGIWLDSGRSNASNLHSSSKFFEWFSKSGKREICLCAGIK